MGEGGGCEFLIDETFLVTGVGVVVSGTVQRGVLHGNCTLLLGPHSDGSFKPVYVRTLHCKRMAVETVAAGDSCAASLRALGRKDHLTRSSIRRGMCLIDPQLHPQATTTFDAEVHILHHPTTIKLGYQAVIHAGMVRQAATIVRISPLASQEKALAVASLPPGGAAVASCLRTGDRALVRFRFLLRPEFVHVGASFLFREGSTKGIGRVVRVQWSKEEMKAMAEGEERERRERRGIAKNGGEGEHEEKEGEGGGEWRGSEATGCCGCRGSSRGAERAADLLHTLDGGQERRRRRTDEVGSHVGAVSPAACQALREQEMTRVARIDAARERKALPVVAHP